jgi:hypothetical protein
MEHYAGIDVSLERSSVCVIDGAGKIVREAKVASEPEALVGFFAQLGVQVTRIGLEAGPLSQWIHAGLTRAGFEVVLPETRQAIYGLPDIRLLVIVRFGGSALPACSVRMGRRRCAVYAKLRMALRL